MCASAMDVLMALMAAGGHSDDGVIATMMLTRKPSRANPCKGNARQQCMYEGPLRTNVKSVKGRYSRSRSSKVIDLGLNGKPIG